MSADSKVWFSSSQGLGRALLDVVLERGERAVATLRKPEVLDSLKTKYSPSQLLILPLDVSNKSQIDSVFEETKKHFGRLDVVVNNAGYGLAGEIETTPEDEARKLIEVLFWGPVWICQRAIPFFRDVNPPGVGGHFLNISSIGGILANPGYAFYHAGKFALEGFTESLTKEMLPEWNIRATIIELGGFRTEWGGSSMITIPSLPVYQQAHAPSEAMRRIVVPENFVGDPLKCGQALYKLGGRKDLPIRIQLGTDALLMARLKTQKTIDDTLKPEMEEIAHSTTADGVDKAQVIANLETAWRGL
ncbi:hypothetical protein QCA50_004486 [Cerrena zonata]|uniref:NAD(P)-binding protein n=1 Tax=Cerrena zonata TaxID=2478898 RepID=A0AAW0GTT8_9APHY